MGRLVNTKLSYQDGTSSAILLQEFSPGVERIVY